MCWRYGQAARALILSLSVQSPGWWLSFTLLNCFCKPTFSLTGFPVHPYLQHDAVHGQTTCVTNKCSQLQLWESWTRWADADVRLEQGGLYGLSVTLLDWRLFLINPCKPPRMHTVWAIRRTADITPDTHGTQVYRGSLQYVVGLLVDCTPLAK